VSIRFELLSVDAETGARRGRLHTRHGTVETPAFMTVGTLGSVKTLDVGDLRSLGSQIVLANAFHLSLRPGSDIVADAGGLHGFTGWDGPFLADSGGFQVFSMGRMRALDDDGVSFRSHLDGSLQEYTPESVVELQWVLNPDISMPLDVCPPGDAHPSEVEEATRRTHLWLERAVKAHREKSSRSDDGPVLFGIAQGGTDELKRRESARRVAEHDLPGYAAGGLSVGEPRERTWPAARAATEEFPAERPRYLMGVGAPWDLVEAVACGYDMFDCVLPTRNARTGTLFTTRGKLVIKAGRFARDFDPPDVDCGCPTCRVHSRAYLRHLLNCRDLTGYRLATVHNVHHYLSLMREVRRSIESGTFARLHERVSQRAEMVAG
jgi:queuine tRNA-ribosyltransferase